MGGNTITIWYDADNDGVIDSDEPSKIIYISNGGRIQYEVRQ